MLAMYACTHVLGMWVRLDWSGLSCAWVVLMYGVSE